MDKYLNSPSHIYNMTSYKIVEYVWADAANMLRSKVKLFYEMRLKTISDFPIWNFDGSSTGQSEGKFSDVFLKPVRMYNDPFRKNDHLLLMCECYDDAECKLPNFGNRRFELANLCEKYQKSEPWAGIE